MLLPFLDELLEWQIILALFFMLVLWTNSWFTNKTRHFVVNQLMANIYDVILLQVYFIIIYDQCFPEIWCKIFEVVSGMFSKDVKLHIMKRLPCRLNRLRRHYCSMVSFAGSSPTWGGRLFADARDQQLFEPGEWGLRVVFSGHFCASLHVEHARRGSLVINYRNTSGSLNQNEQNKADQASHLSL